MKFNASNPHNKEPYTRYIPHGTPLPNNVIKRARVIKLIRGMRGAFRIAGHRVRYHFDPSPVKKFKKF